MKTMYTCAPYLYPFLRLCSNIVHFRKKTLKSFWTLCVGSRSRWVSWAITVFAQQHPDRVSSQPMMCLIITPAVSHIIISHACRGVHLRYRVMNSRFHKTSLPWSPPPVSIVVSEGIHGFRPGFIPPVVPDHEFILEPSLLYFRLY